MRRRVASQPDLFAPEQPDLFAETRAGATGSLVDELEEHPGEEFIQDIRDGLHATLALARNANSFPWPDQTRTYYEEMHFYSMSNWLPRPEAVRLRRAFAAEMDRLYEAADLMRPDVYGMDLDP